jgi:hypothetical protein
MIVGSNCFIDCKGGNETLAGAGSIVLVASALAYGAGTVAEIVNAPRAASRYSERRRMTVTPMLAPNAAGVSFGARF